MSDLQSERLAAMEDDHFWFVGRRRLLDRLTAEHGLPAPVLDLGCGTGFEVARLAAGGVEAVGVDLHPGVGAGVGGRVASATADRLPVADSALGTVLARDVLEHVDDRAALIEVRRILRPGGRLYALVPGWPSLWSERDVVAGHLRRYRRRELRAAVEEAGLHVLRLGGYQAGLLPVTAASRAIGRRRGRSAVDREDAPPAGIGRLLGWISGAELRVGARTGALPPTGSTLVLVAERP